MTETTVVPLVEPRLKTRYADEIKPALLTEFGYTNVMQVPGVVKVIAVFPDTQRVLVEGINQMTRHTKAGTTGRGARTGGIVTQEAPVHVSNVAVVDPETKTPTRVRTRLETVERDGRQKVTRIRVAVRSGKDLS